MGKNCKNSKKIEPSDLLDLGELRQFSDNYFHLITHDYAGLNLTAIKDPQHFFEQQVADSVLPFLSFEAAKQKLLQSSVVLDFGCGGGVPLLPLAFQYPQLRFLGVDGRQKKIHAVEKMSQYFHFTHVKTLGDRVEKIDIDLPKTTVVVKAVGKIEDVLGHLTSVQCHPMTVFFFKGSQWEQLEFAHSPRIHNNWKLEEVFHLNFPHLGDRYLLMYQGCNESEQTKSKSSHLRLSNIWADANIF